MRNIIIYLIIVAISTHNFGICYANMSNFARVTSYYTYIYKTKSFLEDYNNILCLAETTYFVKILENTDTYCKVEYNGIVGYVDLDKITKVSGTPLMPYPNNVTIVTANTCNLRSSPKTEENNILTTIPKNTTSLTFIGRTIGEEAIDFGGNTWYYVKYNSTYGYIYNKYVESISSIFKNTETLDETINLESPKNPITSVETITYIIILSIPFLVILCILYIKPIKREKTSIKHKH